MKKLYVIRHAKSSWKDFSLADWERPLNKRGKGDLPEMGDFLVKKSTKIDTLVSSHAVRAFKTAKGIAEAIQYPPKEILINKSLYHASEKEILEVVKGLSKKTDVAAIFGHNPGFTDFVNSLTNSDIYNIPTCGICLINLKVKDWKNVSFGMGELDYFMFPKGLD